jgi:hypothetical protein
MSAVYNSAHVERARELHDAGYGPAAIIRVFQREFGATPAVATVHSWTDESYRRHRRAQSAEAWRRTRAARFDGRLGQEHHTLEFKQARIRALAEAGVPHRAISQAMTFDYGEHWSRHQVDYVTSIDGPIRTRPKPVAA